MIIDPEEVYSKYGRDIGNLCRCVVKKAKSLEFLLNNENQQELDSRNNDTHLLNALKLKNITTFADLAQLCEREGRVAAISRDEIARLIGYLDEIRELYREQLLSTSNDTEIPWKKCSPRERYVKPRPTIDVLKGLYVSTSIERHIERIHSDYLRDMKTCSDPCIRFRKDSFDANYQDHLWQKDYLLRYMVAYAFEYKEMYKDILCDISEKEKNIKITSLGCGSAIDFWSLQEVIKEYCFTFDTIQYVGVDTVKWDYSFGKSRPDCKKSIVLKDAGDYMKEKDLIDENIIIFPRSIGDFSDESFKNICNSLENKTIGNDCIYLMISGTKGQNEKQKITRCNNLIQALNHNNYVITNHLDYQCSDPQKGVKAFDGSLRYPKGTLNNDYTIKVQCNKRMDQLNCHECQLNRKVMLLCEHINYYLLKFERKS